MLSFHQFRKYLERFIIEIGQIEDGTTDKDNFEKQLINEINVMLSLLKKHDIHFLEGDRVFQMECRTFIQSIRSLYEP